MLQSSVAPAPQGSVLSEKLSQLAVLKQDLAAKQAAVKTAEAAMRTLERECIDLMSEATLTSVKMEEVGSFTLTARSFLKLTDIPALLPWLVEQGLVPNEVRIEPEAHQATITFDFVAATNSKDEPIMMLRAGCLDVDISSKTVGDHLRDLAAEDKPYPNGVEPSITTFITFRPAK